MLLFVNRQRTGEVSLIGEDNWRRGVSALTSDKISSDSLASPDATYRLQFNKKFRLEHGRRLIPYLKALGISHLYSSPLLKARRGSLHCYDVTDHSALNPEIGSWKGFEKFARELTSNGLSLIVDIVPNHMAADLQNALWKDVLRNGDSSEFAAYFDIFWNGRRPDKIVLPMLGQKLEAEIQSGKIKLLFSRESLDFSLKAGDQNLPLSVEAYRSLYWAVLESVHDKALGSPAKRNLLYLQSWIGKRSSLGRKEHEELVSLQRKAFATDAQALRVLRHSLRSINSDPEWLAAMVREQHYLPEYWLDGLKDLNYRKFFNLASLVGIREENPAVFDEAHELTLLLIKRGFATGLRIDHIDGLWNPRSYLEELSERARGQKNSEPIYLVVEKILTPPVERLPSTWKVAGTTGYEFLNDLNAIFVDSNNASKFKRIFAEFTDDTRGFEQISSDSKMLIVRRFMQSDVLRLVNIAEEYFEEELGENGSFWQTVERLVASFPVYRTYIEESRRLDPVDLKVLKIVMQGAKKRTDKEMKDGAGWDRLQDLLDAAKTNRQNSPIARKFFISLQQVSSAVVAKGIEDTAFYRYFPLASLNEVGGSPDYFGSSVADFHRRNAERFAHWPHTMLTTSTHDTKRSEDVRCAIDLLSEMPLEWQRQIRRWRKLNERFRVKTGNLPSRRIEYLLYQTLVACLEASDHHQSRSGVGVKSDFVQRMVDYALKASKEAKLETSWIFPNRPYETALETFVRKILSKENPVFLSELIGFSEIVRRMGRYTSLSQVLLKLTLPGVPDFYQGSELWNYSLVDPDNRRPVDFAKRAKLLSRVEKRMKIESSDRLMLSLLKDMEGGEIKLLLTMKLLRYRRENHELFWSGAYIPVALEGERKRHAVAFLRTTKQKTVLVAAARFFHELLGKASRLPIGEACWKNTFIRWPEGVLRFPKLRNVLTGEELFDIRGGIKLSEAFRVLPLAVLEAEQLSTRRGKDGDDLA
jgi:(1->4)-alpha-D-glucan 1-alpha-D-glucosylmutase